MHNHIHHVHIFASNLDESIRFYRDCFGGELMLDQELAGARNVFMKVGEGRLHFYDQAPRNLGRASIHHFGIQTDDMTGVLERLETYGVELKKGVTDLGVWRYIMVPAPDDILIELFEVDMDRLPAELRG